MEILALLASLQSSDDHKTQRTITASAPGIDSLGESSPQSAKLSCCLRRFLRKAELHAPCLGFHVGAAAGQPASLGFEDLG